MKETERGLKEKRDRERKRKSKRGLKEISDKEREEFRERNERIKR